MRIPKFMLISSMLAMSGSIPLHHGNSYLTDPEERIPKNKYNLTPAQIETLQSMTPKEKKKYLKGILTRKAD